MVYNFQVGGVGIVLRVFKPGVVPAFVPRIAATEPEWTVELIPPQASLPAVIGFDEDGPTAQGRDALAVIAWAAQRLARGVVLTGDSDQADIAAERLREQGVEVQLRNGFGPLRVEWAAEE